MEADKVHQIHRLSRVSLAFVFIYHGLIPKILWLSKLELAMVNAHGVGLLSPAISRIGGVLEIILGISILALKKSLMPVYLSVALLTALLLDVSLTMPSLLIEAFNPVTINLVSLVMAYFIIITQPAQDSLSITSPFKQE